MQQYPGTPSAITQSKSSSRALVVTLFVFMFLGFLAGFGILLFRNWYLFS